MMTTVEVAEVLGVPTRNVYRAIKRSGMRWSLRKHEGQYEFGNDDVIALARMMKARNLGHLVRTLTPNAYTHDASHAT